MLTALTGRFSIDTWVSCCAILLAINIRTAIIIDVKNRSLVMATISLDLFAVSDNNLLMIVSYSSLRILNVTPIKRTVNVLLRTSCNHLSNIDLNQSNIKVNIMSGAIMIKIFSVKLATMIMPIDNKATMAKAMTTPN